MPAAARPSGCTNSRFRSVASMYNCSPIITPTTHPASRTYGSPVGWNRISVRAKRRTGSSDRPARALMENLERAYALDIKIRVADEKLPLSGIATDIVEFDRDA